MWKRLLVFFCLLLALVNTVFAQNADSAASRLRDTMSIGEVIIKARTKIKISKDTVSYTVDSFYKNPMATTEDVLKRLPGVEVGSDGKITVQGKEITKIYINGKEYTSDDLRTITQNLPAEVLEKIQVADYYDEDAQFSGVKPNTDKKIINLQFKKKYKGGVYGRAAAGYGTKDRYQGGVFANYITDSIRITGIGNANNTGLSDVDRNSGDNARAASRPQNGVNTKQSGHVNFGYERTKAFRLNGSYDVSNSDNSLQQSLFRTTYLQGDSTLLRRQTTNQNSNTRQHRLNLRSSYQLNEKNQMQLDGSAYYRTANTGNASNDMTAYQQEDAINFKRQADNKSNTDAYGFTLSDTYRKRFRKEGRTVSIGASINYGKDKLHGNNDNINQYYTPPATNYNAFVTEENKENTGTNVNLRYTEPLGKRHLLSLAYNNVYANSTSDKLVNQNNNGELVKDTIQSRGYVNRNMENPVGLTYQYSAERITASAGLDARPYSRYSELSGTTKNVVKQKGINYFPNLSARYTTPKNNTYNLNYNGSIRSPELTQLQPIPDYTDSLNIYIGNPSLRPEINHNIAASYNYYDIKSQRMAWVSIRYNRTDQKIINKSDINASRRITTPVNANGNYSVNVNGNYTIPLLSRALKATFSLNGGYSNNITITNGQQLNIGNYNLQPSVRMVYLSDKWYEGDFSYSYRVNGVENPTTATNILQTHNVSSTGTITLPLNFKFTYYINYVLNDGLSAGLDKDFFLVNAMLDKSFDKPRGFSVRLQAYDVFNNYPNVQRVVGDNYFEDRAVNRVGSYYMCSIVYRFRYFPAGKKVEEYN